MSTDPETREALMDPAALTMLAVELRPLVELREWEAVQMQIDHLLSAARGYDAISDDELQRLRSWAKRWSAFSPALRAWYPGRVVLDSGVAAALHRHLDGRHVPNDLRACVARAWRQDHDGDAWFALLPG